MSASDDMLVAALRYRALGWSVVPIEPRGKRPIVAWKALEAAIASEDQVRDWFRARPDANVGIVTGAGSRLVVLDVDMAHGGFESLARLESEHGAFPPTIEALTGGGGRHLYFAYPPRAVPSRVGILPGIDVRADGGCVVAPPSVHPGGRRYRWAAQRAPGEAALAPLPAWCERLITRVRAAHAPAYWRELTKRGVREGKRNDTIASLAGHLLHFGVDREVALELLLAWNRQRCDPPLPDKEVAAVVESIARLHDRGAARR